MANPLLMVAGLMGAGVIAKKIWMRFRYVSVWRPAAWRTGCELSTELDALEVSVREGEVRGTLGVDGLFSKKGPRLRIKFGGPGFDLRSRNAWDLVKEAIQGHTSLSSGDAVFDAYFEASGTNTTVFHAVLDHETRRTAVDLVKDLDISTHRKSGRDLLADPQAMEERFQRMRDLCGRLTKLPLEIPKALADIVESDPVPEARLIAMRLLVQRFLGSVACQRAAATRQSDPSPDIAVWAAAGLGEKGVAAFLDGRGAGVPEAWMEAAEAILEALSVESRDRIVAFGLAKGAHVSVQQQALEWAAHYNVRSVLPRVIEMGESSDGPEAVAVVGILQLLPDASSEPALLRWLAKKDAAVRTACAMVLGDFGTAAAVEPLLIAAREARPLEDQVRREARKAIDKIQARLGPAERGGLALSDATGPEGAVSLGNDGGEISLDRPSRPPDRP